MSYNNYNNGGYGGYPYPASPYSNYLYPQQQPQVQPQMQQNPINTNKIYATGIEDVRCRQLPVNSDYIFLDNDKPLVYRKTTDATGKMDIQIFKIVPYQEEEPPVVDMSQYVLREDFESLKKDIDKLRESIKAAKKPA